MTAIRDPDVEAQARTEWLKGFIENGINSDIQINAGLAKCRQHNSPFLPSIGQFVNWCKESVGQLADMPSEVEAKNTLIREVSKAQDLREWHNVHPAIYWVYTQKTTYDWKTMSAKDLTNEFSDLWDLAIIKAKSGFEFQSPLPPSKQIEQGKKFEARSEIVARSTLDGILGMLETEPPKPPTPTDIKDLERVNKLKEEM